MDIYDYIINDHRVVARLIDDLLEVRLPPVRVTIFEQIRGELITHSEAEEQTFYAALTDATDNADMAERMSHARHDHSEISDLLELLHDMPVADIMWMEKFGELSQAVRHHVEEEESIVFSHARKLISGEQAIQLADRMDALKARIRNEYGFDVPEIVQSHAIDLPH